jgi:hypothetical protein
MFESKASRGLKTERTRQYVSISIRGTTQLSDIRWGFKTTSEKYASLTSSGRHSLKIGIQKCTSSISEFFLQISCKKNSAANFSNGFFKNGQPQIDFFCTNR